MNKRIVHDALILTAFTLVLGLVLALVYGVTKAPIEAANQAAAQQAYMAVFEEADSFETMELDKAAATAEDIIAATLFFKNEVVVCILLNKFLDFRVFKFFFTLFHFILKNAYYVSFKVVIFYFFRRSCWISYSFKF